MSLFIYQMSDLFDIKSLFNYMIQQLSTAGYKQKTMEVESDERKYECDCGKKYMSYAAVYTHIKLKHTDSAQSYRQKIKKPQHSPHLKGRPKKLIKGFFCQEIEEINIFELSLLKICSILNQVQTNPQAELYKFIQDGKKQASIEEIQQNYLEIFADKVAHKSNILDEEDPCSALGKIRTFYMKFVKHLTPVSAAYFLFALNQGLSLNKNIDSDPESVVRCLKMYEKFSCIGNIWDKGTQLMNLMTETYQKYARFHGHFVGSVEKDTYQQLVTITSKNQYQICENTMIF